MTDRHPRPDKHPGTVRTPHVRTSPPAHDTLPTSPDTIRTPTDTTHRRTQIAAAINRAFDMPPHTQ